MSVELNQEQQEIMNNLIYAFMAGEFKQMKDYFGEEVYHFLTETEGAEKSAFYKTLVDEGRDAAIKDVFFKEQKELFTQEQEEIVIETLQIERARVHKCMIERFGVEAYLKEMGERTRQHWSKIAEEAGDNSLEEFIKRQWQPSGENSEYTVEETETGFQFNVTKCNGCEMAKRFGIMEQAFYWFCEPDGFAAEGFNPNIGFKRTKTLMQGDDCCDHFYYYKDESKKS